MKLTAMTVRDSVSPKSISVSCPAGFSVYGATATTFFAESQVVLDDIRPSSDLTSVLVTAYENDATSDTWQVQAGAICAGPAANTQRVMTS